MTPPYALARAAAAHDAAALQHYPQPALHLVAAPTGNLADIGLRAPHLLQLADSVACEDTRHTHALLPAELPLKTAVRLAAEIAGTPRNALHEAALALKARTEAAGG